MMDECNGKSHSTRVIRETEISELKVTIQRQDSQLKQVHTQLDTRHSDFSSVSIAKEELLKDNQRLLTKLQREKRKMDNISYIVSVAPRPTLVLASEDEEVSDSLESLREENRRLRERLNCLKCHLRLRSVLYIPCGHLLYCSICGNLTYPKQCPKCHIDIKGWVDVSFD